MSRMVLASLIFGAMAAAGPLQAATLTSLGPGGFVDVDGTSNTIPFGETGGFGLIGGSFRACGCCPL